MAKGYKREFPDGVKRITTGCQYCAVGCGYNVLLTPEDGASQHLSDAPRFITPAMQPARADADDPKTTAKVFYKGSLKDVAVAPDTRCDLNKGNHSVRGASQGLNLVAYQEGEGSKSAHVPVGRSTQERLKSPWVRLDSGTWKEVTWETINKVTARLVIAATDMKASPSQQNVVEVDNPRGLGVKLFEYQYLENTYAATKLFYGAVGTPNVAFHDRPSASGSSPGLKDAGLRPHDFAYEDIQDADLIIMIGTNPYENQSVLFMQYCQGKEIWVIDPRRTATADYAIRTGGGHIQPTHLGADSRLIYAIARTLIERWEARHPDLPYPTMLGIGDPEELTRDPDDEPDKKRQASRARSYAQFKSFLGANSRDETYQLETTMQVAGLSQGDREKLEQLLAKLQDVDSQDMDAQPKVVLLYEKGMIWGFNYHNTAALASLGVLLGAGSEPGRVLGRVGGHQKGWAERVDPLDGFAYPGIKDGDKSTRYPTHNATDRYTDSFLEERFGPGGDARYIKPKHNLDNHVFGPPPDAISATRGQIERPSVSDAQRSTRRVVLKNGLETDQDPDVSLLWIIGGNYLGQANDAAWKRKSLHARMKADRPVNPRRPKTTDPDDIADALIKRMTDGGIVCVHQDLFPNPTTECCDIILPAAGWGEETFCRYNAQRRLKLYERFQDMPIHEADERKLDVDPYSYIDAFKHSPKPDWIIFRDVARAMHDEIGSGPLASEFDWDTSAAVADEMAIASHRGPDHPKGMGLTNLDKFAETLNPSVPWGQRVHALLGASDLGNSNAEAAHLRTNYAVSEAISCTDTQCTALGIDKTSAVYTNGVASNGVFLPLTTKAYQGVTQLIGHLSVRREGQAFYFVEAPWEEIEEAFERINRVADDDGWRDRGGVLITNGRVNHLWNNMFHHIRNDYVNDRYPEDMPGTIIEINPTWAEMHAIENGDIVRLSRAPLPNSHPGPHDTDDAERNFRDIVYGIASLQKSVAEGMAFLMFSYPVKEGRHAFNFNFNGYVNNVTDGYADGINPIAALKYGHAILTKVPVEQSGYPDGKFASRHGRPGPLYEQRNLVGPNQKPTNRPDWEMRELIVRKGLPRAFIERPFPWDGNGPHGIPAGEAKGAFWHAAASLEELRNQVVAGQKVSDALPGLLDGAPLPSTWAMPAEMLAPRDFEEAPDRRFPERQRIKEILRSGDESEFEEIKALLDGLINVPHCAIADEFLQPDRFLRLLKENKAVRDRFVQKLSDGNRAMRWLLDGDDANGLPIDEWHGADLELARTWIASQTDGDGQTGDANHGQGDGKMVDFVRVQQILDNAVGGAGTTVHAHGAFWRNVTRDQFINKSVYGLKLIELENGNGSNLVKALRGEAPFDGTSFRRMPAGMSPVPADQIGEIVAWIDAGAPGQDGAGTGTGVNPVTPAPGDNPIDGTKPTAGGKQYRIHPGIGIARLGTSQTDHFIGPEAPGMPPLPNGQYRDAANDLKRQAARFRIYEYEHDASGRLISVREITSADAEIVWTVRLVNRKAEAPTFPPTGAIRNRLVGDRQSLIIDSGEQRLIGPSRSTSMSGTFKGSAVNLGDVRTEVDGRLLILGGFGLSRSVPPGSVLNNFANNDDWHDDVSDGPVMATVTLPGGQKIDVDPAWVVIAPPSYAPSLNNVVTMYDQAWNAALQANPNLGAGTVSFTRDVYPILRRTVLLQWVSSQARSGHGHTTSGDFLDPTLLQKLSDNSPNTRADRQRIFNRLNRPDGTGGGGMPRLNSGLDPQNPPQQTPTALTRTQYEIMDAWQAGLFDADWPGQEPAPIPFDQIPVEDQPGALDRANLESGIGGPFYPGIECGFIQALTTTYRAPFRINTDVISAGDLTAGLAVPWQADFLACGRLWWPAQRPNSVNRNGAFQDWTPPGWSYPDMVESWWKLGLIVKDGVAYVEKERLLGDDGAPLVG